MTRFDPVETFEPGDTRIFTWQASTAPDAAPLFTVTREDGTLVASLTAQQSATTAYWVPFTMPTSPVPANYVAKFTAIKSLVGSAHNVVTADAFRVRLTGPIG
jgi:hypothetical protein